MQNSCYDHRNIDSVNSKKLIKCTCYCSSLWLYILSIFLCSFLLFSVGSHTILLIIQRRLGDSGELLSTEVLQSFAANKYEVIVSCLCWKISNIIEQNFVELSCFIPTRTSVARTLMRVDRQEFAQKFSENDNSNCPPRINVVSCSLSDKNWKCTSWWKLASESQCKVFFCASVKRE